jgi:hypothetical protein
MNDYTAPPTSTSTLELAATEPIDITEFLRAS